MICSFNGLLFSHHFRFLRIKPNCHVRTAAGYMHDSFTQEVAKLKASLFQRAKRSRIASEVAFTRAQDWSQTHTSIQNQKLGFVFTKNFRKSHCCFHVESHERIYRPIQVALQLQAQLVALRISLRQIHFQDEQLLNMFLHHVSVSYHGKVL